MGQIVKLTLWKESVWLREDFRPLLIPQHFKSEYDTKEDVFNAVMQGKLKMLLEAEDGVEQADISFIDNETTIMIQLTYADSVIQALRNKVFSIVRLQTKTVHLPIVVIK